jgi:hypothetical protein
MVNPVNEALFRGAERSFWHLRARGADRVGIVWSGRKRLFDFGLDEKGMARRNAGIIAPQERVLPSGHVLRRFVGTNAFSRFGKAAALGHWWIDEPTWSLLKDHARQHRMTLEQTAQNYLALPDEWGDRGRIAFGRVLKPVMAWSGTGEVALGEDGQRYTPAQHNKAQQLFIPAVDGTFDQAFGLAGVQCIYTRDEGRR